MSLAHLHVFLIMMVKHEWHNLQNHWEHSGNIHIHLLHIMLMYLHIVCIPSIYNIYVHIDCNFA